MLIQIPDHVAAPYLAYAEKSNRTLNGLISAQLERFQALHPGKRCIVVDIKAAEALLGGLPIKDEADLLHRVEGLASLSFGPIRLDVNIAQLKELEHRAARQGKPVEDLVKEIAATILRDLFWASGGGPAKSPEASAPKGAPAPMASTSGGR